MSDQTPSGRASNIKKYIALTLVFAVWLVGDLWTKHWADVTLADPQHPIAVRITDDEVGRPVGEVVAERVGSSVDEIKGFVVKLPEHRAFTPDHKLFDRQAAGADARGYYAFWRSDGDLPPRRINKTDKVLLDRWLRVGAPTAEPTAVRKAAATHLDQITLADWLQTTLRRLPDGRLPLVTGERLHPIHGALAAVAADAPAAAGATYLLEWHRIDVMGDWFKLLYAENPGAAFGFLRGVAPTLRDTIFFVLTIIVFLVLLGILIRTEPRHWVVLLALSTVLGGAVGNFVDRIRYGYVIDFIDMHLGFMHWPTYNVADIAIAVGVVLLLLDVMLNKDSPLT